MNTAEARAIEKELQADAAERRLTPFVYEGLDLRAEAREVPAE